MGDSRDTRQETQVLRGFHPHSNRVLILVQQLEILGRKRVVRVSASCQSSRGARSISLYITHLLLKLRTSVLPGCLEALSPTDTNAASALPSFQLGTKIHQKNKNTSRIQLWSPLLGTQKITSEAMKCSTGCPQQRITLFWSNTQQPTGSDFLQGAHYIDQPLLWLLQALYFSS